ncbi:MAG TPA: DUF1800 domain-containing protein [Candidatus Acidoferrales bacterium]|nr:DUF1800 domain-containing protein [Candidatus Acidoferrales bacterium]
MNKRTFPVQKRLDAGGVGLLAATLGVALAAVAILAVGVSNANAGNEESREASIFAWHPGAIASEHSNSTNLDKKFKGKLPITQLTEDEAIMHTMNRLGYGPRPGDVERIRKMGLEKWIDQQLQPDSIDDSALDQRLQRYPTLNLSAKKLIEEYPQPGQVIKKEGITKEEYEQQLKAKQRDAESQVIVTGNENLDKAQQQLAKLQGPGRIVAELSMAKVDRAVYSNRQLQAVMEDFWFNHFNVFANKAEDKWLLTSYVRDTIRPHTMGKFEDLLLATAKSPAMLIYLDNSQSADPNAVRRMDAEKAMRRARYGGAFAGGVAPTPGTFPGPVTSSPGTGAAAPAKKQERGLNENYGREVMELHTVGVDGGYTQQDVIQMAECLTGWTVHEPRKNPEFFFDDRIHAQGKKVVMGRVFNTGGERDGEEALKMLANHPNTAKFISTELARHFVSDNPPPALVERMAVEYSATQGDTRSVLKTMIYSPEFWSKETYRAKVKTPYELVASTARALNAEVTITLPMSQWVGRMGEPLFLCQPPNGYSDKAETWVNTGALLNRLNFALSLAGDKVAGATVDLKSMLGDAALRDPNAALSQSIDAFLGDQIAEQTRATLSARLNDPQILQASLDDPVKQVNQGLIAGLVLGAPEFQRR